MIPNREPDPTLSRNICGTLSLFADTRQVQGFRNRFSAMLGAREVRDEQDRLVPLSSGEWQILEAFLTHPRRVLSRDQLLDLARGRQAMPFDRSIDIQVSRLRRKLSDDAKEPRIIKTVRSGGYIFTADILDGSDA